jgi:hypothetical protein
VSRSAHIDGRSWSSARTFVQTLQHEQSAAAPPHMLAVTRIAAPPVQASSPPSATAPTMLLQPVLGRVNRERSHFERVERVPSTAPIAGPRGPAGPPGEPGSLADAAMVLARPIVPAVVEASSPQEPVRSAPVPLKLVAENVRPGADAPVPAPDVEELTTQVLRRIERRAIAQRERLGGVP